MRVMKFRVWDKEKKRMFAVPSLHFGDDGSGRTTTYWEKTAEGWARLLVMSENAELMQFTGCQDIHGKDIYEGDIVKWDYKGLDYIRVLRWRETQAMFFRTIYGEVE